MEVPPRPKHQERLPVVPHARPEVDAEMISKEISNVLQPLEDAAALSFQGLRRIRNAPGELRPSERFNRTDDALDHIHICAVVDALLAKGAPGCLGNQLENRETTLLGRKSVLCRH